MSETVHIQVGGMSRSLRSRLRIDDLAVAGGYRLRDGVVGLLIEAQEFRAWVARGVEATVEGHGVLAGDREFLAGGESSRNFALRKMETESWSPSTGNSPDRLRFLIRFVRRRAPSWRS
jgi:hypothetical protein